MKTGPLWVPQIISFSFFHVICQVPCCCSFLSRLSTVLHSFIMISFFLCYIALSTYSISSPSLWFSFFFSRYAPESPSCSKYRLQLFPLLFQNLPLLLIQPHQPILETHSVSDNYMHPHPLNKELIMQGACLLIPSFMVTSTNTSQPWRGPLVQGDRAFQINQILSISKEANFL